MSIRDRHKILVIKNMVTGDEKYIKSFNDYSHFTQASMLEDIALPLLYDYGKILISFDTYDYNDDIN